MCGTAGRRNRVSKLPQNPECNDPDGAWQTRDELCATLGLRHGSIDRLRKSLPPNATRKVGRVLQIHAPTAARTWAKIAATGPRRREVLPDLEDEGGDESTPALERYRAARASIAELELAKKRGELVDRQAVVELFAFVTGSARDFAEQLGRIHGDKAREDFNAWLDRVADGVARLDPGEAA